MPNYQLVNNIDHQAMRVITKRGAQYGDDVMFTMTFPAEMRSIQACYPILIHKDPDSGELYPVAVFGFAQGENLFLEGDRWNSSYIPIMARRPPFLIGFQKPNPAAEPQRVLTIDVDHPRVSESEGEALFLEQGGNSPFLESMADMLETIHIGNQENKAFMSLLLELDLVHSIILDITLKDRSRNQLQGFLTIDDEKLQTLSTSALDALKSGGFLMPAFMMAASLSQLGKLVRLRDELESK